MPHEPAPPIDLDDPPRPSPPVTWRDRADQALAFGPGRLIGGAAAVAAVLIAAWLFFRPPSPPVEQRIPVASSSPAGPAALPTTTATTGPAELVVHAAGAVGRPGIYRLAPDARVGDLIDAAGGMAPDADANRVNLAAPLTDGARAYVPRVGETSVPAPVTNDVPAGGSDGSSPSGDSGDGTGGREADQPINVNTASLEELEALPGVGPATAQAIVEYRDEHGGFSSVDELLEVRGIGEAKLADMRDQVAL